jgi:hypothetical protein
MTSISVKLGEDRLLDLHALGDGLDDEVDVAEGRVLGRALDQADDAIDLRRGLLLGQLALLDQAADLPGRDVAGLGQAGVDELLLDVLEHDGDAGRGDRLRDLPAHRPGADDGGLEHEHCGRKTLLVGGVSGCCGGQD